MTNSSSRQPTIFDVASRAGVSKSVVSRVMRGESGVSAEKTMLVRRAAEDLGYVPSAMASGLASRGGRFLGVVVRNAKMPFYGYLHSAMQQRARERGYQVVAISGVDELSAQDMHDALRDLIAFRVAGLIICSAKLTLENFQPFVDRVPIVVAGHEEVTRTVSSVFGDETDGGRQVAQYVYDYGHRNIAVFLLSERYSYSQHNRSMVIIRHLRSLGAEPAVYTVDSLDQAGAAVDEALRLPLTTAFMCPSDTFMIQVLSELRKRGLSVPGDLSVCGYGGFGELASDYLGFTGYRQPLEDIGRQAVDRLLEAMKDSSTTPSAFPIRGHLIPGRTVRRHVD